MANTDFMEKKYSLEALVTQYCEEIQQLRSLSSNPQDEAKIQGYYQAASFFKKVSIMDLVQFALAWGRGQSNRGGEIKEALATVLGNRVAQPSKIDLAYQRLFLDYARAFKEHRGNLKEWMLRFIISSRFSPLQNYFEEALNHVIQDAQNRVVSYEATL